MEAYEFRAYEVLGYWTMVLIRVHEDENGAILRELIYKGDHVPIDEVDPQMRAALLLVQVCEDLNWDLSQMAAVQGRN